MSQNSKQPNCKDRIEGAMNSRLSDLKALYRPEDVTIADLQMIVEYFGDDASCERDALIEEIYDLRTAYGLHVDVQYARDDDQLYLSYLMSFGGPEEELRLYMDHRHQFKSASFIFKDWFDGALREVTDQDHLETARALFAELVTSRIPQWQILEALEV